MTTDYNLRQEEARIARKKRLRHIGNICLLISMSMTAGWLASVTVGPLIAKALF